MSDDAIPAGHAAAPAGSLPAGLQLNGTYEIDRLIATGGMGEVYRGHLIETGDPVAIKVIRADMVRNEAALALFRKEASALHHLHHEAIIRYFVVAIDPGLGRPYLAMEFVEGEPLSEIIRRGALPEADCFALLDRLAAGLGAAHQIGIFHRDVSPDNIILPEGDVTRAKIIDFGIAKSTRFGATTVIGDGFAGKYSYVSPEQLGLYGGQVTERSDIYSLGLVIAEASAGQAIDMGANHAETIERRRAVPPLDGVAAGLRPLLSQMLQPLPEDRPGSMAEVRRLALQAWPGGSGAAGGFGGADPTLLAPRARGRLRAIEAARQAETGGGGGRRRMAWLALAALLAAAVPAALYVWPGFLAKPVQTANLEDGPYLPLPSGGLPRPEGPTPALRPAGDPARPQGTASPDPEPDESAEPAARPGLQPAAAPPSEPPRAEPPVTPTQPSQPPPLPAIAAQEVKEPAVPARPVPEPPGPSPDPAPAPSTSLPAAMTAEDFVARYPPASCFLLTLRKAGPRKADIEAFGSEVKDIEAFDRAFARSLGYEADIQFRAVSDAQCPAIEFLARFQQPDAEA
ncbi:MAG: serine/threonine-protein kinase, partial [Rhabdaerophilum calidifontis]